MQAKGVIKDKHFGSIFKSKPEQLEAVVPYLIAGLQNREKCIYIYSDNYPDEVCDLLATFGVDIDRVTKEGQLLFLPKEEAYIPRGFFSPEDVLDFIQYAHYDALKSGFVGIRGSGEMEWSLKKIPGIERLIYYENRLNEILGRLNISLLCQYNETKFPEKTLLGVIYTHPDIILYGQKKDNPYYVRPDIFPERFDQYTISVYGQIRDRIFSQEFS